MPARSPSLARETLRDAGLRHTPARARVLDLLAAAPRPVSAADVLAALPDEADAVTVYRTLAKLVDVGLARKVRGDGREWLYERAVECAAHADETHGHAHFVCDGCGTVECVPAVEPAPPPARTLGKGYEVTRQEVTLHGTCPKCA